MRTIYVDITPGEFLYYIVDQDQYWVSPYNIGDFVQEHFGYFYMYIGVL